MSPLCARPGGSRVAIEPGASCGVCEQCKAGRYNLCPAMQFFAAPPVDGALAEYVEVRADLAFDLPDSVSDDPAALLEPLSVAIWATGKARVTAGSRVLIAGAGPIGPVTAQVARAEPRRLHVLPRLGRGRRFRAQVPRHQPVASSARPRGQGPPPAPGGPVPGPDSGPGNNGGDPGHPSEHPRGPGLVQNGHGFT
jgi:D-arabinose 1-dehydrogenase-like Zn-dependent alcohol dehydrogenase